jgi:hypothetical protein
MESTCDAELMTSSVIGMSLVSANLPNWPHCTENQLLHAHRQKGPPLWVKLECTRVEGDYAAVSLQVLGSILNFFLPSSTFTLYWKPPVNCNSPNDYNESPGFWSKLNTSLALSRGTRGASSKLSLTSGGLCPKDRSPRGQFFFFCL